MGKTRSEAETAGDAAKPDVTNGPHPTAADLAEQNALAKQLIGRLMQIQAIWRKLPAIEEVERYAAAVDGMKNSLDQARHIVTADRRGPGDRS